MGMAPELPPRRPRDRPQAGHIRWAIAHSQCLMDARASATLHPSRATSGLTFSEVNTPTKT
jgi:hypothetical protein